MNVNYCPESDALYIDVSSNPQGIDSCGRSEDLVLDYAEVKDLEIINRYADELNKETLDVLDYQVAL